VDHTKPLTLQEKEAMHSTLRGKKLDAPRRGGNRKVNVSGRRLQPRDCLKLSYIKNRNPRKTSNHPIMLRKGKGNNSDGRPVLIKSEKKQYKDVPARTKKGISPQGI